MIATIPPRRSSTWGALCGRGVCRSAGFLAVAVAVLAGCGGAQKQNETSQGSVVGEPPSEQSDPFRIMNTPEKAEEASSSGYIGDEADDSSAASSSEAPQASDSKKAGDDRVAVEASEADPPDDGKEKEPQAASGEIRCFSCVRICPIRSSSSGAGAAQCGEKTRDVICGWGVHESRETARRLARAECDGALEMARRMQTWSRIEGSCPAANCRTQPE